MATGTMVSQLRRDELRKAFDADDRDGNGFISAAEIGLSMLEEDSSGHTSAGELSHYAKTLLRLADGDGDGLVSYEEYCIDQDRY